MKILGYILAANAIAAIVIVLVVSALRDHARQSDQAGKSTDALTLSTHGPQDAQCLRDLDAGCVETEEEIFDLLIKSYLILLKDGVQVTPQEMDDLLHRAAQGVRSSRQEQHFKLIAAGYCVVRQAGKSHETALGCVDDISHQR